MTICRGIFPKVYTMVIKLTSSNSLCKFNDSTYIVLILHNCIAKLKWIHVLYLWLKKMLLWILELCEYQCSFTFKLEHDCVFWLWIKYVKYSTIISYVCSINWFHSFKLLDCTIYDNTSFLTQTVSFLITQY